MRLHSGRIHGGAKRIKKTEEEPPTKKKKIPFNAEKFEQQQAAKLQNLTSHVTKQRIGMLEINKGMVTIGKSPMPFIAWDACMECNDHCPIQGTICKFENYMGKCKLQRNYLNEVLSVILADASKDLDRTKLTIIGLKILPLYTHLFKFKLLELHLGIDVTVPTKSGLKIHPVYKEIRETMKLIVPLLRLINVGFAAAAQPKIPTGDDGEAIDINNGDTSYYDSLSK